MAAGNQTDKRYNRLIARAKRLQVVDESIVAMREGLEVASGQMAYLGAEDLSALEQCTAAITKELDIFVTYFGDELRTLTRELAALSNKSADRLEDEQ